EKVDVSTETSFNESLYQQLKDKREELAVEKNIEESQIFTDTLLKEIAKKMPENKRDMIKISGIGNYKLKHYSPHFLKVIYVYLIILYFIILISEPFKIKTTTTIYYNSLTKLI